MYSLFFLLLLTVSFTVSSETFKSRIESIDYPDQMPGEVLAFLSNGQVVKIPDQEIKIWDTVHKAKDSRQWLQITTDDSREISQVAQAKPHVSSTDEASTKSTYIPSVLKSPEWANKYFNESRRNSKHSQCFNRAHVWSYEWHKKHRFYSSKMFLFFTRKFIRDRNFEWWFHVAPYVHVTIGNKVKERVMDMKYSSGPQTVKNWLTKFTKSNSPCLTVKTYSDYANYPENGQCYLMRASMYYYWPLDLENEELNGTIKTSWAKEEVDIAYEEAFEIVKQ
jgi:hypothetical protein